MLVNFSGVFFVNLKKKKEERKKEERGRKIERTKRKKKERVHNETREHCVKFEGLQLY